MQSDLRVIFRKLSGQVAKLEKMRQISEKLLISGQINQTHIDQIYAGLFLNLITLFEGFLDELFVGIALGKLRPSSIRSKPNISFKYQTKATAVIYAGRPYADWLPYEITEKRAKLFLHNGRPFTALSADLKREIERAHLTRNAIAHNSEHAIQRFRKDVIGSTTLLPIEKQPIKYVRGTFRINPPVTRFEHFCSIVIQAGDALIR